MAAIAIIDSEVFMLIKRLQRPLSVEKVSLICVTWTRGDGSAGNPERFVDYFYNDHGAMVACYDEINGDPTAFVPLKPGETAYSRTSAAIDAEQGDVPTDSDATGCLSFHRLPVRVVMCELIHVTALRGNGRPEDPEREVSYYYDYKGNLMACSDLLNGKIDWVAPVNIKRIIRVEE